MKSIKKKEDLVSGAVLRVPLLYELGFAYIRLIFVNDLTVKHPTSEYLIVDCYCYKSVKEEHITIDSLEMSGWLSRGMMMFEYPRLRGESKAMLVGNVSLDLHDFSPPLFKRPTGISLSHLMLLNSTYEDVLWAVVKNLNPTTMGPSYSYHQVAHLADWQHCSYRSIQAKITMQWLKYEGKKIEDYFDINFYPHNRNGNTIEYYQQVKNLPIPYPEGVSPYELAGE